MRAASGPVEVSPQQGVGQKWPHDHHGAMTLTVTITTARAACAHGNEQGDGCVRTCAYLSVFVPACTLAYLSTCTHTYLHEPVLLVWDWPWAMLGAPPSAYAGVPLSYCTPSPSHWFPMVTTLTTQAPGWQPMVDDWPQRDLQADSRGLTARSCDFQAVSRLAYSCMRRAYGSCTFPTRPEAGNIAATTRTNTLSVNGFPIQASGTTCCVVMAVHTIFTYWTGLNRS